MVLPNPVDFANIMASFTAFLEIDAQRQFPAFLRYSLEVLWLLGRCRFFRECFDKKLYIGWFKHKRDQTWNVLLLKEIPHLPPHRRRSLYLENNAVINSFYAAYVGLEFSLAQSG